MPRSWETSASWTFTNGTTGSRTGQSPAMTLKREEEIKIENRPREQRGRLTRAVFTRADTRASRVSRQTVAERRPASWRASSSSLLACGSRAQSTWSATTKLNTIIDGTKGVGKLGSLGIASSLCCPMRLKKSTFSDRSTFRCWVETSD